MNDDNVAAGGAVFTLFFFIYILLIGWFLKLGAWIFGKGFNTAALHHRVIWGFILMFIGMVEMTFLLFVWYVVEHSPVNAWTSENIMPAVMDSYIIWLGGSAAVAFLAALVSQMKRAQNVADEIRAQV